jgi:hypothetical protein
MSSDVHAGSNYPVPQVKQERTYWRDERLSQRHRQWGLGLPAIDLDFILLEYDRGKPTALIEYKSELAAPQFPSHPSYLALSVIGDAAQIPVFVVRYTMNFTQWIVIPINEVAKRMHPNREEMTERGFVTFLYQLRGLKPSEQIFKLLEMAI